MTMSIRKSIELAILALSLAVFAACGGGSSGGGGAGGPGSGEVATTAGGETITTVGGVAVTVAAHNHWKSALELFEKNDKSGWNDAACSAVREGFEKALKAQRGNFGEAEYMIGLTYSRCGDIKKAKEAYEKVLAEHPKMCSPRVGLGLMLEEAGDEAGAQAIYNEALKQNPNCPSAYVNIARFQSKGKPEQVDEAIANLRRALAFRSDYLPAFNEMALIYYRRGSASRERRSDLDLAEIVLRQAQLIDKAYAPIYNTWGLIKLERGDLLAALQMFQQALELDSSIFEAQMNFGQITLSFRGYRDAKKAFERAVQLRPRNYEAVVGLGAALRGLEEFEAAEKQYKKAIEIDPNRPDAYFNVAILFHEYLSAHADSQDGTIARLREADRWYDTFVQKAGKKKTYAEKVEDVTRRCKLDKKKKKRRGGTSDCQMGRKQVIEEFIAAMIEAQQMQREMEEMERLNREQGGG
jgi:tetratricopeptide (TPR) repeat protein